MALTPVRRQGTVIEVVHPFLFAVRRVQVVTGLAEKVDGAAAIAGERDRVRTRRRKGPVKMNLNGCRGAVAP